jgi:hypothetical protein
MRRGGLVALRILWGLLLLRWAAQAAAAGRATPIGTPNVTRILAARHLVQAVALDARGRHGLSAAVDALHATSVAPAQVFFPGLLAWSDGAVAAALCVAELSVRRADGTRTHL